MTRHETRRGLASTWIVLALAIAAACATQAALGAHPSSAQSCTGALTKGKAANETQYSFTCDLAISGRYVIEARGGAGETIEGTLHDPTGGFTCAPRPAQGEGEGEGETGEREEEEEGAIEPGLREESLHAADVGLRRFAPTRPLSVETDLSTWECTGGSAAAGQPLSGRFATQKEPCSVALSLHVIVYPTLARRQPPIESVLKLSCSGAGNGSSGPGAPRISALRVTPATFRAASHGGSVATPIGTTVAYKLSLAARTTFTVQRIVAGVKQNGRCVAAGHARGARCTRYVNAGAFKRAGVAGLNRLRLTGRLAGHKLRPGPYRLKLTARSESGLSSNTVASAPFHIVA